MNQLESVGVLLIGLGVLSGSIATTHSFSIAVIPAIFTIAVGIALVLVRRYR
jgi:hypothetical protein